MQANVRAGFQSGHSLKSPEKLSLHIYFVAHLLLAYSNIRSKLKYAISLHIWICKQNQTCEEMILNSFVDLFFESPPCFFFSWRRQPNRCPLQIWTNWLAGAVWRPEMKFIYLYQMSIPSARIFANIDICSHIILLLLGTRIFGFLKYALEQMCGHFDRTFARIFPHTHMKIRDTLNPNNMYIYVQKGKEITEVINDRSGTMVSYLYNKLRLSCHHE